MSATGNIIEDKDCTYRWVYEFNLLTNPTILLTVVKVFLGIIAALVVLGVVLTIPDLVQGYADAEDVLGVFRSGGIMALLFIVLTIVGYAIYALMNGGKYCVLFTMDDEGITHKQLPREFKKAQVVAGLNVLAGLAAGNLSQMGMGILTATHDTTVSTFSSVSASREGPPASFSKVTPKSSHSSGSLEISGMELPRSQLDTAW